MLRFLERTLFVLGTVSLAIALVIGLGLTSLSQNRFAFANTESIGSPSQAPPSPSDAASSTGIEWQSPDQSDWSTGRIAAFVRTLTASYLPEPVGALRIPAVGIEAAIFDGTGESSLNAGLGTIEGTARIGESGNAGLAGHRDGHFRRLKDISIGDVIEIAQADGLVRYRVDEILIVNPEDVFVLDPTPEASLTLVTCYPFYFLGSAPQRFIVKGARIDQKT